MTTALRQAAQRLGRLGADRATTSAGGSNYSGPMQCAADIVKREGMKGLLRGWTAQYVRLGPQTTVIFLVMEQLRKLANLDTL